MFYFKHGIIKVWVGDNALIPGLRNIVDDVTLKCSEAPLVECGLALWRQVFKYPWAVDQKILSWMVNRGSHPSGPLFQNH